MAKSVKLVNGREWKTQSAAKLHFKEMLARYADGDVVTDLDDHSDLAALLERFDTLIPDSTPKIGIGISHFERRRNAAEGWSGSGFWVVRIDASETDFSYIKAVEGKAKSEGQEFYDACHNAVSSDLVRLKQKQFDHFADAHGQIKCDITEVDVIYADAKLAHANPPFISIVNSFRREKGWVDTLPIGTLTQSKDAQLSTQFSDPTIAQEFVIHHHKLAVLHIVAKKGPLASRGSTEAKKAIRFQ